MNRIRNTLLYATYNFLGCGAMMKVGYVEDDDGLDAGFQTADVSEAGNLGAVCESLPFEVVVRCACG